MREVARKLGRGETDKTLTSVWKQLREDGEVDRIGGVWQCSAAHPTLEGLPHCTAPGEDICEACGATLTEIPRALVCVGCASRGGVMHVPAGRKVNDALAARR